MTDKMIKDIIKPNLYIFKVDPKHSYVGGMALIVARSFEEACEIFRKVTYRQMWPEAEHNPHDLEWEHCLILGKDTKIAESLRESDTDGYGYNWYLEKVIEFVHLPEGFVSGAFHDG